MKKKFDRYTINVLNKSKIKKPDGTIELKADLTGNIEIGLDIDNYTWRMDWFLELFFGKDYSKYQVISVENHNDWTNSPCYLEINRPTVIVRPR